MRRAGILRVFEKAVREALSLGGRGKRFRSTPASVARSWRRSTAMRRFHTGSITKSRARICLDVECLITRSCIPTKASRRLSVHSIARRQTAPPSPGRRAATRLRLAEAASAPESSARRASRNGSPGPSRSGLSSRCTAAASGGVSSTYCGDGPAPKVLRATGRKPHSPLREGALPVSEPEHARGRTSGKGMTTRRFPMPPAEVSGVGCEIAGGAEASRSRAVVGSGRGPDMSPPSRRRRAIARNQRRASVGEWRRLPSITEKKQDGARRDQKFSRRSARPPERAAEARSKPRTAATTGMRMSSSIWRVLFREGRTRPERPVRSGS